MESHEVIRNLIDKAGAKMVAEALGLSLPLIYKWSQPAEGGSGTANPLDRVADLLACSQDRELIRWLCQKAGGIFVEQAPAREGCPLPAAPATNEIVQEFAEMLSLIARSAEDQKISQEEGEHIRRDWEHLKSVTEGFVRCCEAGNFERLK